MNIYQKMAAVTADLQTVAKNLTVETAKGKGYKAVSERDIIDAVKPLESQHGIYSYPCDRTVMESQTLESESTWDGKTTKKTSFFSRIKTVYRFVNIDDPAEFVETVTFAEGIDSQDKGSGKAMTYADKYALMKAYKISTGDDPDQTASEEAHYTGFADNATAERIQKGLAFIVGDKVEAQRELLKEYGYSDVYKVKETDAGYIISDLLKRARTPKPNED